MCLTFARSRRSKFNRPPRPDAYFDSADENGEVIHMRCELQSGSLLKCNGWTADMLESGSEISITGSPDRTDPTTSYMSRITFKNGVLWELGRLFLYEEITAF